MAFRRMNRRRFVRRRRFVGRSYKGGAIRKFVEKGLNYNKLVNNAAYLAGTVQRLYSQINSELKHCDTVIAQASVGTGAVVTSLCGIAEGDDTASQRNGRSILAKYLSVKATFNANSTATRNRLRWLIVLDKDQNGTVPTIGDVLQDVSSTMNAITSPLEVDVSQGRYVILHDEIITTCINGGNAMVTKSLYKPIGAHIKYIGTDGSTASQGKNSIYNMWFSDDNVNGPTCMLQSRLRYYDN